MAWILDKFNEIKVIDEGHRYEKVELLNLDEPVDDEFLFMVGEEKRKRSLRGACIGMLIIGLALCFNLFGVVESWLRT